MEAWEWGEERVMKSEKGLQNEVQEWSKNNFETAVLFKGSLHEMVCYVDGVSCDTIQVMDIWVRNFCNTTVKILCARKQMHRMEKCLQYASSVKYVISVHSTMCI